MSMIECFKVDIQYGNSQELGSQASLNTDLKLCIHYFFSASYLVHKIESPVRSKPPVK